MDNLKLTAIFPNVTEAQAVIIRRALANLEEQLDIDCTVIEDLPHGFTLTLVRDNNL